MAPVSGHVFRFDGKRRSVWRAKYRLPDGRQVKKTIGPAWTERGRPAAGYYTSAAPRPGLTTSPRTRAREPARPSDGARPAERSRPPVRRHAVTAGTDPRGP